MRRILFACVILGLCSCGRSKPTEIKVVPPVVVDATTIKAEPVSLPTSQATTVSPDTNNTLNTEAQTDALERDEIEAQSEIDDAINTANEAAAAAMNAANSVGAPAELITEDTNEDTCPMGHCNFIYSRAGTYNANCDGGSCEYNVSKGAVANISCMGGGCQTYCEGGASCNVSCFGGNCDSHCAIGADCNIECSGGGCETACIAATKSCFVDCPTGDCETK
jgi:hypothetical protein